MPSRFEGLLTIAEGVVLPLMLEDDSIDLDKLLFPDGVNPVLEMVLVLAGVNVLAFPAGVNALAFPAGLNVPVFAAGVNVWLVSLPKTLK